MEDEDEEGVWDLYDMAVLGMAGAHYVFGVEMPDWVAGLLAVGAVVVLMRGHVL